MIDWKKPKSEKFIERHMKKDYIWDYNWENISICQNLSEAFIERHQDELDWRSVSRHQRLSEHFIGIHIRDVDLDQIFAAQKLSPLFIKLNAGDLPHSMPWTMASMYQKLSEDFIERNANFVNWGSIIRYQLLSEAFIKKHESRWKDSLNGKRLYKYQKLSKEYREREDLFPRDEIEAFCNDFLDLDFNEDFNEENWLYKSTEDKLKYVKEKTKHKVVDDKYIIAYKTVRSDGYSVYNFQYKYEVGGVYTSQCDCNVSNENSYGLSAWNKKRALSYHKYGKLLKVKINIEDIGAIVQDNGKIRCFKLEVLSEVKPWYKRLFNKS